MSGSDNNNRLGAFDEKGNPNILNYPGGRKSASGWYDCTSQELWVFGGNGYEALHGKETGALLGNVCFFDSQVISCLSIL